MIFQARIHGPPGPHRSCVAYFLVLEILSFFFVPVRESLVSDFSESSKYHARYLKMVGTTIGLTIIGILIFIQVQKPDAPSIIENYDMPENIYRLESYVDYANLRKSAPTQRYRSRGFQRRQWEIVGHAKTSKQYKLRQHLKHIQLLISDLKYFPQ